MRTLEILVALRKSSFKNRFSYIPLPSSDLVLLSNNFWPMFPFYTFLKHKTKGSQAVQKKEDYHWPEITLKTYY